MKTKLITLFCLVALSSAVSSSTTYRDSQGRTTGTESKQKSTGGVLSSTYRDASGKTTGTSTERKNGDGSTTKTNRDASGKTISTETKR